MGMRITNITEVITAMQLVDRNVNEGARLALRQGAENVKKDAVAFAPVLHYRLEKAIKILPARGNQYSLKLTIAVTGVIDGKSVDKYAAEVHEYSWERRGALTQLKSPKAGPRYLFRAMEKNKKDIEERLSAAVNSGITTAIAQSGVNRKRRSR